MQAFSSKYTAQEIENLLKKARNFFNASSAPSVTYGTFTLKRYIKSYNGHIPKVTPVYGHAILPEEPTVVAEAAILEE